MVPSTQVWPMPWPPVNEEESAEAVWGCTLSLLFSQCASVGSFQLSRPKDLNIPEYSVVFWMRLCYCDRSAFSWRFEQGRRGIKMRSPCCPNFDLASSCSEAPRWPSGQGVHLKSNRPRFDSHIGQGDFSGSSQTSDLKLLLQWLPCWVPGIMGQCWDWLAQCQCSVTG